MEKLTVPKELINVLPEFVSTLPDEVGIVFMSSYCPDVHLNSYGQPAVLLSVPAVPLDVDVQLPYCTQAQVYRKYDEMTGHLKCLAHLWRWKDMLWAYSYVPIKEKDGR